MACKGQSSAELVRTTTTSNDKTTTNIQTGPYLIAILNKSGRE